MGLGAEAIVKKYEAIETINKLISENDIKADEISVCRDTVATCNEAVMKSMFIADYPQSYEIVNPYNS